MLGFDAISVGGVLSWLMECMTDGLIVPEELGIKEGPIFSPNGFRVVEDSMHNANIGVALLDQMVSPNGAFHLREGARKLARHRARQKGTAVLDSFFLHRLCPFGLDGSKPVLDSRCAIANGHHGQVLHVLRKGFCSAPSTGKGKCQTYA